MLVSSICKGSVRVWKVSFGGALNLGHAVGFKPRGVRMAHHGVCAWQMILGTACRVGTLSNQRA